jgi:hypothetical protein
MPPHILGHPRPKIADVQCSRIHFEPGDRVLVKVYHQLDKDQIIRLRKSIQKWAGVEVEVLIYNGTQMEIGVEHLKRGIQEVRKE